MTQLRLALLCMSFVSAALLIGAAPSFGTPPLFSVSHTKTRGRTVSVSLVTQPHYRCSLTLHRGRRVARRVVTANFRGAGTVTLSSLGGIGKVTVAGSCVPGDYQPPVADQSGTNGPQFVDDVAARDGAGASLADAEGAIGWAMARLGNTQYNWWCLKFVANAYGAAAAGFENPVAMVSTFGLKGRGTAPTAAPRGALMIFSAASDNGFNGHVGISLGDGRMVDAETTVAVRTVQGSPYWRSRYIGWISPPAQWPGRPSTPPPVQVTPPPAQVTPPPVQVTPPPVESPHPGPGPDSTPPSTPSGFAQTDNSQTAIRVNWNASSDNVAVTGYDLYVNGGRVAAGVAPNYVIGGLGCGTSYTLGVDAYDAAGNHSAQAKITGTTQGCPPPTFNFTITGTCRAGCGLWMFSGPDYHTSTTRHLPDGTVLQIVCQTRGATLSEAGYTSAIWDKTIQGDWASDLYLNTPVYGDFSPGIPRC